MTPEKRTLITNIYKKLGLEDEDFSKLVDILIEEDNKLSLYKEAVCENISDYHNQKKEFITLIEELVIVLSATRDYENDRQAYSVKQEELLRDTGTDVLVKAFRVLGK